MIPQHVTVLQGVHGLDLHSDIYLETPHVPVYSASVRTMTKAGCGRAAPWDGGGETYLLKHTVFLGYVHALDCVIQDCLLLSGFINFGVLPLSQDFKYAAHSEC